MTGWVKTSRQVLCQALPGPVGGLCRLHPQAARAAPSSLWGVTVWDHVLNLDVS